MNFDQIDEIVTFDNSAPWNFSSIVPKSTYSMSVLPVDSFSIATDYPNATHVLVSENGEFFLAYSSESLTSYGKIGTSTVTNYSTPLVLMNYPFDSSVSHNDSVTSTYRKDNLPLLYIYDDGSFKKKIIIHLFDSRNSQVIFWISQ